MVPSGSALLGKLCVKGKSRIVSRYPTALPACLETKLEVCMWPSRGCGPRDGHYRLPA